MEKDEEAHFKACEIKKYVGAIENCKAKWKLNGKISVSGAAQNVYLVARTFRFCIDTTNLPELGAGISGKDRSE